MTDIFFLGCDTSWQLLQLAVSPQLTDDSRLTTMPYTALDNSLAAGTAVTVFYSLPQVVVAGQLANLSVTDALNAWQQSTQALLQTQRKHRRQLKLICLDDALQNGLVQVDNDKIVSMLANMPKPAAPSLLALMAKEAIQQTAELTQLADLLHASSLPTQSSPAIVESYAESCVEHWFSEYRALKQSQQRMPQLEQQLQEFRLQLELVQQELEVVFAEKQQMQLKLTPLQRELEQQTAALTKANADNQQLAASLTASQQQADNTKQENELLLLQLLQVQEELEKYYLQYKQQQTVLQKADADLAKQKQQLEQNSKQHQQQLEQSIKQHQQQLEQLNKQYQQQQTEQTKSYQHLQQRSNQAEQQHADALRQATARHNSLNLLQKQAERELVKAQAEIEKLQRQLAGASLSGHQAMAELKTVKSSTMWKAMAPVRKLSSSAKKKQLQLQKDISLIRSCALFDQNWYLQSYPDVEQSGADAIEHYLKYGAKEGRAPGPDFDGNWYLSHYPDVGSSGINPLIHYIKFGQIEGRQTSPKLLQLKQKP